ncbi:MAG: Do family serine endopeptidase [Hyphomicrobiales bacterium]
MKSIIKSIVTAFLGAILAFGVYGLVSLNNSEKVDVRQQVQTSIPIQNVKYSPLPQGATNFVDAAEKTVNAVVHIRTEIQTRSASFEDFYGSLRGFLDGYPRKRRQEALVAFGSGVIISNDGYIVTNNHVVEGADKVSITLNDKREFKGKIIGQDPTTDLALVKIEASDLPYLTYGDSDKVRIGEWVLAVGNPFNLTSTVTAGIVSAKARNLNILGGGTYVESFIQTDAAVNRGNSGGALVNTTGDLVGINAAIASHTGSYEGYSFAIPVNIVRKVVDDLLRYGETQRAYLGVVIQEVTPELAKEKSLGSLDGVYINAVSEGGAALKAGLRSGDIILNVNGKPTNTFSELVGTINQYSPGEKVEVDFMRDGKEKTIKVVLRNEDGTTAVITSEEEFSSESLGATLRMITIKDKRMYNIDSGLKVENVNPNGVLANARIGKGFIITDVNKMPINNKKDLERAFKNSSSGTLHIKGVYPNGMKVSYEFIL